MLISLCSTCGLLEQTSAVASSVQCFTVLQGALLLKLTQSACAAPAAGTAAARNPAAQLEQAVGDVLKQSSAAATSGASATWHAYADYYEALGFHASTREALLKHVSATSAIHPYIHLPCRLHA